jgi:hypothetical protein
MHVRAAISLFAWYGGLFLLLDFEGKLSDVHEGPWELPLPEAQASRGTHFLIIGGLFWTSDNGSVFINIGDDIVTRLTDN